MGLWIYVVTGSLHSSKDGLFWLKINTFHIKKKIWKILCFNYFPFYDECYTSPCLVWDKFIAFLLSNKIANWIAVSTYFNVQLPTRYDTPQSVWSYVRLRNVGEIHSPYRTSAYTAGAPSKYKLYKISQFLHTGLEFHYVLWFGAFFFLLSFVILHQWIGMWLQHRGWQNQKRFWWETLI